MKLLRSVTPASLLHWEDAAVLHLLAAYSLSEQSGKWQDRWSSSRFLRENNIGQLVGCDAGRVIGPNTLHNADRGDIFVVAPKRS